MSKKLSRPIKDLTKEIERKKDLAILSAIDEGELPEFIQRQYEYKKTFLLRVYKEEELKEIRQQLDSGNIKVKWFGMTFPKELLKVEHDLRQHDYFQIMTREKYLYESLKKSGMTEEQIKDLMKKGKTLKELPKKVKDTQPYIS